MNNWQETIDTFFQCSDPSNDFRHLALPGASAKAIAETEATLGLTLPTELGEFYSCFNGIGMATDDEPDIPRLIPSLDQLATVITAGRSWLKETHPDWANRFLPFLDLENGDYTGYCLDENGQWMPCVVTFLHEYYQFDADQDIDEFLVESADSLKAYLSPS
jgi:hypothetical protein